MRKFPVNTGKLGSARGRASPAASKVKISGEYSAIGKKRGRLCCHKRPKSREETPKEGIGGKTLPRRNNIRVRRTKSK
jgi:hypothetical protein